ncbi:hypothetical protein ACFWHL_15910 [Streptomyces massasporeus]
MGAELGIAFLAGIVTPSAMKKAKAKIKPWLREKLKGLLEEKDD